MVFEVNAIVRVARQPSNQFVQLVGEVAYVEEVGEAGFCTIQTLKLDGGPGGCGAVPMACLEAEPGVEWAAAFAARVAERERLAAEGRARGERIRAGLLELARKHGMTVEAVERVYADVYRLYDES